MIHNILSRTILMQTYSLATRVIRLTIVHAHVCAYMHLLACTYVCLRVCVYAHTRVHMLTLYVMLNIYLAQQSVSFLSQISNTGRKNRSH